MGRSLFFYVLCAFGLCCDAYKILVVFPFPSKSHGILGEGVVKHLLDAGHNVTYVTPYPTTNIHPNLQQIDVSTTYKKPPKGMLKLQDLMDIKMDIDNEDLIQQITSALMIQFLENKDLRNFLEGPRQKFDAVITEWMFSEVYSGFSAVFNCPQIWFFPFEDPSVVLKLIDEYPNPAYTPSFKLTRDLPYNFRQRIVSLWTHAVSSLKNNVQFVKRDNWMYLKYFRPIMAKKGRKLPPFEKMRMNASLALVNAHISFGLSIKRPFNYINIGGYHIDTDLKPLPEDLQKIMNNAKYGVIYFSMGTTLKSTLLPEQLKMDLLKMFGGLNQIVLWKFDEMLLDLPENVHIMEWAPQQSILSHPNCILFITHGGLLSTTETVHFGVPAIGIPVYGDQYRNVDAAVIKGYVKRVDLTYLLPYDLGIAINETINDPKYMENVKQLSLIYHDRPVSPGAELVHWVEHVVRTRGAPHLRSPAVYLFWYQRMYLDLCVLIICIILFLTGIIKYINFLNEEVSQEKKKSW